MQRPNATKCIHFHVLVALAVACAAATGEQPVEDSEWPTKNGYRIARQWTLQADEEPNRLRLDEDMQETHGRLAHEAKAKSKKQLPQRAYDEGTWRRLWHADNAGKLWNPVPSPNTADEGRQQLPGEDTEDSPLLHQAAGEVQRITGSVTPEVKTGNGRSEGVV